MKLLGIIKQYPVNGYIVSVSNSDLKLEIKFSQCEIGITF